MPDPNSLTTDYGLLGVVITVSATIVGILWRHIVSQQKEIIKSGKECTERYEHVIKEVQDKYDHVIEVIQAQHDGDNKRFQEILKETLSVQSALKNTIENLQDDYATRSLLIQYIEESRNRK